MSDRHDLIAYIATLVAIVVLTAIAAFLAAQGKLTEAVGTAAAITGLIGVMRMPVQSGPRGTPGDPVAVTETEGGQADAPGA